MNAKQNDFVKESRNVIRSYLEKCKLDGVVAIGFGCLWSCVAQRLSRLPSAPRGTSAAWVSKQVARNLATEVNQEDRYFNMIETQH